MSWEKVKLGDIAVTSSGGTPNRSVKKYWENGNIPWIKSGQLKDGIIENAEEFITEEGLKSSSSKYFKKDTLLLAMYGATAGKLGFLGLDATTNQAVCSITPKTDNLSNRYLFYFLLSQRGQIISDGTGGAQPNISQTYVNNIEVPLPPLPIQKQIADTLDKADELRKKDELLLKKYDELAQSIFYDMFGDPVENEKGWEVKKLKDLITFMTSGSRGWAQYYRNEGDVFLRINNIKNGNVNLKDVVYVEAPDNAEAKRTSVHTGDVIMSITADLGRTAVIPEHLGKAFINQHLCILRLGKEINPYYLSYFLESSGGKRQILKSDKGGVKAGLNFSDIIDIKILLPTITLQNKFAKAVCEITNGIEICKRTMNKSETLFNGLLNTYFS